MLPAPCVALMLSSLFPVIPVYALCAIGNGAYGRGDPARWIIKMISRLTYFVGFVTFAVRFVTSFL